MPRPKWSLFVALAALALLLDETAQAEEKVFVANPGTWFDGNNWSPAGVPGAADVAVLGAGRTAIVDAPASVGALELDGGALTGTSTLTVVGLLSLKSGAMNGSGTTTAQGGIDVTGGASLGDTRTLVNAGAGVWSGGTLQLAGGAVLANSGTLAIQSPVGVSGGTTNNSGTIHKTAGGGEGSFSLSLDPGARFLNSGTLHINAPANFAGGTLDSSGTIEKTAGSGPGLTRCTGTLNNTGSVNVASGVLELDNGGTHTGAFTVQPGGVLELGGGAHTLSGGDARLSGAGLLRLAGGTTDMTGGVFNVTGTTSVVGGTHSIGTGAAIQSVGALQILAGAIVFNSGDVVAPATLSQGGGTLGGSDAVTLATQMVWQSGTINGSGTLNANAGIDLSTLGTLILGDTRKLNTGGATTWSGFGSFQNAAGAVITNAGAWDIQTAADMLGGRLPGHDLRHAHGRFRYLFGAAPRQRPRLQSHSRSQRHHPAFRPGDLW